MAINAALAYRDTRVQTGNSSDLTLMLYDGMIKFSNIAIMAIEKGDMEKAHMNIIKAEKIVTQLRSSLDFKYPVAQDFENVYEYIYERLVEANLKKDKEIIEDTLEHMRLMRDTWKEVMAKNHL